MPRKPRELSPSGFYHVILRGINKQTVFASCQEKSYFLKVLQRMGKEREYEIIAYCLMNNHAHMLIKTGSMPLDVSMKRISVSYVYYYNKLHNRSGSLFDYRYTSVVIKNEVQLMICARYIHNNPVSAEVTRKPEDYMWSSYRYYMGLDQKSPVPLNTKTLLSLYDSDINQALKCMQEFTEGEVHKAPTPLTECIENILDQEHVLPEKLKYLPRQRRDRIIRMILAQTGAKAKELSEILGVNTTIIYNSRRSGDKK